ncbi:MAG: leucine-rich repeat domain-containing protein, partial [Kiritimatiellae bacterium]|nr:leucine-rich repeat domain-containing protein [Kiritimatiellia bacterium]
RAVSGCRGLTSVTIPSSVTSIGDSVFYDCSGLTSVTIPSSVTNIGEYAFRGCSGLTTVTIPSGVTSIGYGAFYGCSGLTSVTIPSSVTSIGRFAFSDCSGLTSVTIPSGVTSIGRRAFEDCRGLTSVTIPGSVASIGSHAFYNCSGLTSVTISEGVTIINSRAFSCSGLESITIPSSVSYLGNQVFCCENLKTVRFRGNAPDLLGSGEDESEFGDSLFNDHDGGLSAPDDLCVYVPKNSVGWAGTFSTALPSTWQSRKIVHSEDMVDWRDFLTTIGVSQRSEGGAGYSLSGNATGNAKISSMTVSSDVTISSFELVNGKVMDMAIRIVNTASSDIRLRLPTGYAYETIGNGNPLIIPANSTSMVTITQTTATTFLVSRQKLSVIQQ